jgi:hypothetical protein
MPKILLTEEQAQVLRESLEPVEVVGPEGVVFGSLRPRWSHADIVDAERRLASDEPRFTTAQVLEHLRSLERE